MRRSDVTESDPELISCHVMQSAEPQALYVADVGITQQEDTSI